MINDSIETSEATPFHTGVYRDCSWSECMTRLYRLHPKCLQLSYTTLDTTQDLPMRIESVGILMVEEGEGRLQLDLHDYTLNPLVIAVLRPVSILGRLEILSPMRLVLLNFSEEVNDMAISSISQIMPVLVKNKLQSVFAVTPAQKTVIRNLTGLMESMVQEPPGFFREKKLESLLRALQYELLEIAIAVKQPSLGRPTRRNELMTRFVMEVSQHYSTHRTVGFYADRLCISPKHLSAVVKEASGRTASEWINKMVTAEAQMLLRATTDTIQQVAARLNFPSQSLFGKYFKHQTGMSPRSYRQKYHTAPGQRS